MQLDEIIANPNLYPPKERKEQKSTYYSIKKEMNKLDQLLQGNQIENKVIEVEPQKEIQQQKLIEKKMPFKDVISLLYDFKIGDKKIDKYTKQEQIQEIKEIPYVLNNIEKQERQQFQLH